MIPWRRARRPGARRFAAALRRVAIAMAASLAVGGCTLVSALHTPPPEGPTDAPIPPSLHFTMDDGAVLPARAWYPPAGTVTRGIILALHGFEDSRDAWELPAPVFAAAGYVVYAPDQRGFGDTADRGRWAGTDRMVNDAAALAAQLRATHPGVPLTVMGESMGGAVALLLAARPGQAADSYVLLAPAVLGWRQLAFPLGATLRLTNAMAPGWAPDPGRVSALDIHASDNIPALIRLGSDPLTIRRPRVDTTAGLVDLMTAAQDATPNLHGAVLILSGRRDQLVPPRATALAWSHLPPGVRRAFYPHGFHLLLRDTDRALVEADILAWLADPNAWLPSGADAAAGAWDADHAWQTRENPVVPAERLDTIGGRPIWPY